MARAKKTDYVGADERGTGCADAAGSGANDALELCDGAGFVLAVISDVIFHGSGESLSVLEYSGALKSEKREERKRITQSVMARGGTRRGCWQRDEEGLGERRLMAELTAES